MTTKELVIIGAGGLGRETAALVETINAASPTWRLRGFLDENTALHGRKLLGYPVLGDLHWLEGRNHVHFVIAIGASQTRTAVARHVPAGSTRAAPLVHPDVFLHPTTRIGQGVIICAGCSLTVDLEIAAHTIINLHCTVGHDAQLQDFVTLHPGVHLSGGVTIKRGAELGTGTVVLPGITVGQGATVGAGAVVTRDLPPGCTAVGVPAQPLPE